MKREIDFFFKLDFQEQISLNRGRIVMNDCIKDVWIYVFGKKTQLLINLLDYEMV